MSYSTVVPGCVVVLRPLLVAGRGTVLWFVHGVEGLDVFVFQNSWPSRPYIRKTQICLLSKSHPIISLLRPVFWFRDHVWSGGPSRKTNTRLYKLSQRRLGCLTVGKLIIFIQYPHIHNWKM